MESPSFTATTTKPAEPTVKTSGKKVSFDENTTIHHIPSSIDSAVEQLQRQQELLNRLLDVKDVMQKNSQFFDNDDHENIAKRVQQLRDDMDSENRSLTQRENVIARMRFTCAMRKQLLEGLLQEVPLEEEIYKFFVSKQIDLEKQTQTASSNLLKKNKARKVS